MPAPCAFPSATGGCRPGGFDAGWANDDLPKRCLCGGVDAVHSPKTSAATFRPLNPARKEP
jgi:hypothetical protein